MDAPKAADAGLGGVMKPSESKEKELQLPESVEVEDRWVMTKVGSGILQAEEGPHAIVKLPFGATLFTQTSAISTHAEVKVWTFVPSLRPFTVKLSYRQTVGSIKDLAAARWDTSASSVRLIFRGRECRNSSTPLARCGLDSVNPNILCIVSEAPKFTFASPANGFTISADGLQAHVTGMFEATYILRGSVPLTSGIHSWDVRIVHTIRSNIFIGLGGPNINPQLGLGNQANTWFYCCSSGYFESVNADGVHNSREYAEALHSGDVLTVVWDMNAKELSFLRNGVDFGSVGEIACPSTVFPIIQMGSPGDKVALVRVSSIEHS